MVSAADKLADAVSLREKNIVPWLMVSHVHYNYSSLCTQKISPWYPVAGGNEIQLSSQKFVTCTDLTEKNSLIEINRVQTGSNCMTNKMPLSMEPQSNLFIE